MIMTDKVTIFYAKNNIFFDAFCVFTHKYFIFAKER